MNAIERIKAKLAKYPDARYSEHLHGIEVHPKDRSGFTVSLWIHRPVFTVSFDGWHEEFTSEDEALNCFAFGLSSKCRLAVVTRLGLPVKWIVESLEDGVWAQDSEVGMLVPPFWPSRTEYRQNRVFDG